MSLSLLLVAPVSSQEKPDPLAYLTHIGSQYDAISKDMLSYTSAVNHGKSARKIEKKRKELILQMTESEKSVRSMKPFNGNAALRDSIAAYFKLCKIVLNQDYEKILDMEDIAEQSYDAMEAYLLAKEKANDKVDNAAESAHNQYTLFATNNNIRLIETDSKLSQKLEASKKVNEYYNKVYLLFFKSHKNEAYLLDAINRGDAGAMEQTKNSLLSSATEDMGKLGPVSAYEGDATLKNACRQLMEFYIKECAKIAEVIDFHIKKENFDKIKKAMDAKRPNERTTEDVNNFNRAVQDYNAAANKSNNVHSELNKQRTTLLNNWNETVEKFLDGHTPKYR